MDSLLFPVPCSLSLLDSLLVSLFPVGVFLLDLIGVIRFPFLWKNNTQGGDKYCETMHFK